MTTNTRQALDLTLATGDSGSTKMTLSSSADVTRGLNYFDGRFLRAEDLNAERRAQRAYVDYSNRAGGTGIVYGFELSVDGAEFKVEAGLAVDRAGRLLLLDRPHVLDVAALVATAAGIGVSGSPGQATGSAAAEASAGNGGFEPCAVQETNPETPGTGLYLVVIERTEVLEGKEDVLGRLCDSGCTSATDSRYVVDAVTLRAIRLTQLALPTGPGVSSLTHERSQVASALFDRERAEAGSLLSGPRLSVPTWCAGAAATPTDGGVPIAVLKWDGASVLWYDLWSVRRERMEPPTSRYWAGRVEMRPWSVFLAQLLQFQCQLADLATGVAASRAARGTGAAGPTELSSLDWIEDLSAAMSSMPTGGDAYAARKVTEGMDRLRSLQAQMTAVDTSAALLAASDRVLLDSGLVTLPPAGYLQTQVASGTALRHELATLFGPGVDLHVCAVRRDQVPHELERAAHMDRISLVRGLMDTSAREQVDVLVPDGVLEDTALAVTSHGFAVDLSVGSPSGSAPDSLAAAAVASSQSLAMKGVARFDGSNGLTARVALTGTDVVSLMSAMRPMADMMRGRAGFVDAATSMGKLKVGTEPVSLPMLREVARAAVTGGAEVRGTDTVRGFIRLPVARATVTATSASLWTARDIFEMPNGDSTGLHAEWDVIVPQASTFGVMVVVDGRVLRVSSTSTGGGLAVTVQVDGLAVVSGTGVSSAEEMQSFSRTLVLTRSTVGSQDSVVVKDAGSTFTATVRWSGAPILATGEVSDVPGSDSTGVQTAAHFEAAETGLIYQAGNEYRDTAISAVQLLSALRPKDALYVDRVLKELFPEAISTSQSLVSPVEPWVLFRRRRREECEGSAAVPVPDTSTVAGWVVTAADQQQAEAYRSALLGGGGTQAPWTGTPVDVLSFETNTATLRSSSAHWRDRYQAVGGGDTIWFAGYAQSLSSSDLPIGPARVRTLVDATAPLAALDPSGPASQVDLVPAPPAGQMISGTEGSVFLITYPSNEGVTVTAVDGTVTDFADTFAAIKGFDPVKLKAGNAQALTLLTEASTIADLSPSDINAAVTKIDDLTATLHTDSGAVARNAYVWVRGGSLRQESALEDLVKAFVPNTTTRKDVDFEPDRGERVRVYLTLEPIILT